MAIVDSRYVNIATAAATIIIGSLNPADSLLKGILAQWRCEKGGLAYPPSWNNPGNLSLGFAKGLGFTYTIPQPNPQPDNPIVAFTTPLNGAKCYGKGIATYPRYAQAVAEAKAGSGYNYMVAVSKAGYGTPIQCMNSVWPLITLPSTVIPDPGVNMPIYTLGGLQTATVPAGTPWFDYPNKAVPHGHITVDTVFFILAYDQTGTWVAIDGEYTKATGTKVIECGWVKKSALKNVMARKLI